MIVFAHERKLRLSGRPWKHGSGRLVRGTVSALKCTQPVKNVVEEGFSTLQH